MLVSGFHDLIALLISGSIVESPGPFKFMQNLLRFSGNSGRLHSEPPKHFLVKDPGLCWTNPPQTLTDSMM